MMRGKTLAMVATMLVLASWAGRGFRAATAGEPRPNTPFPTATHPKDEAEQKMLAAMEEILQKQGRMHNVPAEDGRLLRLMTEAIGAKTVIEIGTSNGISAIWICMGLRKTGGKLITLEIDKDRAALARQNFVAAGVADMVTVVEGDAHETITQLKGPVDLVFIDAEKSGYLDYLKKCLPLVRPGGLILAHNTTPRMIPAEFIKAITTDPELETVFFMGGAGMSVTLKKR
jgi:predicted O-methyltransferase YrrM